MSNQNQSTDNLSTQKQPADNYDPHIIPAETAARMKREGDNYKKTAENESGVDTTSGYTVDGEGLVNNYAIEPEMYAEVPGDMKEQKEADARERVEELQEVNEEGGGKHKGPGVI